MRDAQRLLDDLLVARRDTLSQLREMGRRDALADVTGKTAFDDAIEQTRKLIERLSASLERTRKALIALPARQGAFDETASGRDAVRHDNNSFQGFIVPADQQRLTVALGAD